MMKMSPLAAAALSLAIAAPAAAQTMPMPAACAPLVGTFLTLKSDDPTADPGEVGRSLVTLSSDGIALMTDTAQSGGEDFQPFSDASGAWVCDGTGDDGAVGFRAVLIDFTFPTEAEPDQQVVRIDIAGRFEPVADMLAGDTRVSFFPVGDDPLDPAAATSSTGYAFTGRKVTVAE